MHAFSCLGPFDIRQNLAAECLLRLHFKAPPAGPAAQLQDSLRFDLKRALRNSTSSGTSLALPGKPKRGWK